MEPTSSQNLSPSIGTSDIIGPKDEGLFPDASIVIFHLDTTNQNTAVAEIIQIAAWCKDETFNECILPNGMISPPSTGKNGFKVSNRKLFHNKIEVNAVPPKDGLQNFLNFLSDLTGNTRSILLAANNCKSIHRHILVRLLKQYNLLDTFKSLVLGFIDTIDVFKSKLTDRKYRKESFGVEELANDYLDRSTIPQQIHAVVFVNILVSLIEVIQCNDAMMKHHVMTLDGFILGLDLNITQDQKLEKIAEAGFTTSMLKDAYRADPIDGVSNLLAELKLHRVTVKKITDQVSNLCAFQHIDENGGNGTA